MANAPSAFLEESYLSVAILQIKRGSREIARCIRFWTVVP